MGRVKRVRNMKKVLRAHGSPVPKGGYCGVMMLALIGLVVAAVVSVWRELPDT